MIVLMLSLLVIILGSVLLIKYLKPPKYEIPETKYEQAVRRQQMKRWRVIK